MDEGDEGSVSGDVIRFMWDYSVHIPLWGDEGKLPEEPEWLRRELGLSDGLIDGMATWGHDMCELDGTEAAFDMETGRVMDERARDLVERLRAELGSRYRVVYKPW